MITTESYKNEYLEKWWEASSNLPEMENRYDYSMQKSKEAQMEALIDQLLPEVKKDAAVIEKESPLWGTKVRGLLQKAGDDVLKLSGGGMKKLLNGGYLKVTSDFIEKAHEYDTLINIEDIMQAMRNAWIMNCIQVLFGKRVEYTPSLFAYSMLYPYTDNFLDSKEITADDKNKFGKRFRQRLEGEGVLPVNQHEGKVFGLIDIIESEFDRNKYPKVYESLIAIHDAQQNSLRQQKQGYSPYEADILGFSIKKGGASVLADGYLVNGTMTERQASFLYGFGVFLQLVDDAQDVAADKKNNHMTIFSQIAGKCKLDAIMSKLFNFMFNLLDSDECFNQPEMKEQKLLIKSACILLLLAAVSINSKLYSSSYLKTLEQYSPLSINYLKKLSKKAGKECFSLFIKNAAGPLSKERAIIKGLLK